MSIYTRIGGTESPRIPVHTLVAAAAEYVRGEVSGAVAASWFDLSQAEKNEMTELLGLIQSGALSGTEVHDVLLLLEAGKRDVSATKTRLGVS